MYTRAYANNDLLFLGLFADFYERYLILITPGFIASRQSLLEINVPLGAASLLLLLSLPFSLSLSYSQGHKGWWRKRNFFHGWNSPSRFASKR